MMGCNQISFNRRCLTSATGNVDTHETNQIISLVNNDSIDVAAVFQYRVVYVVGARVE